MEAQELIYRSIAQIILMVFLASCAKSDFHGNSESQEEAGAQVSQEALEKPIETVNYDAKKPEPTVNSRAVEPEADRDRDRDKDKDHEIANEPVMVGGAFLVCVQSAQVECRLDTNTQRNIVVPAGLKVEFFQGTKPVTYSAASIAGFRWRMTNYTPNDPVKILQLKISAPSGKNWKYWTDFEAQPLQIGDGTTALQGCTQSFVKTAKLVGITFSKTYQVQAEAPNFFIDLLGLCGIVRANDSLIQILDSNGVEVFKQFLPTTPTIVNVHYPVTGLLPGPYTIRIKAGDAIDIDDLFINGLSFSTVGR